MSETDGVPAPLTPPDCDLRDFAFMPLDVARLRDSDLSIQVGAEEFRAAVLLWCAAWHQVPAASLPDDDKALAALAGYGRIVAEWRKHREGALYGWVKCSDGRLYHPVVAEKARDAWLAKHKHAHDKLMDRVRKANKQREQQQLPPWVVPSLEDWIAAGFPLEGELFPAEEAPNSGGKEGRGGKRSGGIPPENALKGQGEGYIKEKEIAAAATHSGANAPVDNSPPPSEALWLAAQDECADGYAKLLNSWEKVRGKHAKFVKSDARLIAWEKLGVTRAELAEAYHLAVGDRQKSNDTSPVNAGFLDVFLVKVRVVGVAASGMDAARPAGKAADTHAWALTASGVEGKGADLGVELLPGEQFPDFKARVHAAAGLTDADRSRLLADFGVRV